MAYFSNGSENCQWMHENCDVCLHWPPSDHLEGLCAVYTVHLLLNYDQMRTGNEDLKKAMEMLVPMQENGFAGMCRMFIPSDPHSIDKDDLGGVFIGRRCRSLADVIEAEEANNTTNSIRLEGVDYE